MTNRILVFVMLLSISCSREVKSGLNNSESELFDKYLELFQSISLPIVIDRAEVIKLNNDRQALSAISYDIYKQYIPDEIRNEDSDHPSSYRAFCLLPEIDNNVVVLLAKDIFIESEMYSAIVIYLICYAKDSEIIDFKEIALFRPESAEAFVTISEKYEITRVYYQRKLNTNRDYSKFAFMIETKSEFRIEEGGNIREKYADKIEGFFELHSGGYKLVKRSTD